MKLISFIAKLDYLGILLSYIFAPLQYINVITQVKWMSKTDPAKEEEVPKVYFSVI
jgi:hypothetical protein